MKISHLIKELNLKVKSGPNLDSEVNGGYVSDLLSDVIANSKEGNVWITLQIHQNILAVATMKDLAGIILVNSREPDPPTIEKAKAENINILISELPAFELVGKLFEMGIKGT